MPRPAKHQLFVTFGVVAALLLPAGASAEYYIPPGNSGANQYTEALPGAGGDQGGRTKSVSPGDAIGEENAKRLEDKGPAGEAAAQLAAETAPAIEVSQEERQPGDEKQRGDSGSGSSTEGSGADSGKSGGASGGENVTVSRPGGSSGLSSVLGEATGASDGNLGLWLPLAIVATLLGAILYRLRARHQGSVA